jgi:hypothetical protein
MTSIRLLIVMICVTGLAAIAFGQSTPSTPSAPSTASATPPRVTPADAKNHIGETVTVCGKVVDSRKVPKYGIAGHGKPVSFDLDQPETNAVFYFVAFGAQPGGPEEVIAAYKDKGVCVTGKIAGSAGTPFILAADRSQIKVQAENK